MKYQLPISPITLFKIAQIEELSDLPILVLKPKVRELISPKIKRLRIGQNEHGCLLLEFDDEISLETFIDLMPHII